MPTRLLFKSVIIKLKNRLCSISQLIRCGLFGLLTFVFTFPLAYTFLLIIITFKFQNCEASSFFKLI